MFLDPKKKSSFAEKDLTITKSVSSLTPEEHLLKQLSLRYLVDQSLSVKEVAKKLNTTQTVIKRFFEDPEYTDELAERMDRIHGIDTEFMQSQAKLSLFNLYEEMRRREVEGQLKDIPIRELHKILVDTQREIRLDTPGAFTSKVGVADLTNLQDRYSESLSGKFHRQVSKKGKMINSDTRLLEEGSENSSVEEDQVETRGAR
jgi:plasmid maintenance system antidote protein VapI